MVPSGQDVLERESAWLNLAGAARLLSVNRSTLSKQAQAGRVRHVRLGLGRGEIRVSPAEVLRLASVYQRVSLDAVRRALARELASRLSVSENELLTSLEGLSTSVTVAPRVATKSRPQHRSVSRAQRGARVSVPARRRGRRVKEPPVVDLGWLEPRLATVGEMASSELVRALDALRPQKLDVRIVDSEPETISLGDLQPGERF